MRKLGISLIIAAIIFASGLWVIGAGYTPSSSESGAPTASAVTNGATMTVTKQFHAITGSGLPSGGTNILTLAAPPGAGFIAVLTLAEASSNVVSFADQASANLGGTRVLGTNDTLTLIGLSTTKWLELSFSNN